MNGMLLASGQNYMADLLLTRITSLTGLYVGLMTTQNLVESYQLGTGITEITGAGYARQKSTPWTKITSGDDPVIEGYRVIFEVPVGQIWANVNGYFVSLSSTGPNILWAEPFAIEDRGERTEGDIWTLIPRFEQRYYGE